MITTTALTWISKLFIETGWPYALGLLLIVCLIILLVTAYLRANKTARIIPSKDSWLGHLVVLLAFAWVVVPWTQQLLNPRFREWRASLSPGIEAYEAEEYEEALPILAEAADEFPEAALVHMYLGNAHRQLGDYQLAEQSYEQVLRRVGTGQWPVEARKALRKINPESPLLTGPDDFEMHSHDIRTVRAEGSLVARSLFNGLIWFFTLSGLLAGYGFIWVLIVGDRQNENPTPTWFIYFSLLFLIFWIQSQLAGAHHSLWFSGFSGWHSYWLTVRFILSASIMHVFAKLVYEGGNSGVLTIWVACLGLLFLGAAWFGNRPDKIVVLLPGTISVVCVVWGTSAMRSLGDLSETPVLSALTRCLIAVFAWILLPLAAHLAVIFKLMPQMAAARDWSIPSYFWELSVIQWIQNISGGLL